MKYVVDKIEGDLAVLENIIDGNIINLPIDKLPNNIRETDVVLYDGTNYKIDEKEKNDRILRIKEKMERLRKNK